MGLWFFSSGTASTPRALDEPNVEDPKAHLIKALSEWVRTSSVVATTGATPEGRAGLDGINLVTIASLPENLSLVGDSIAVSSIWTLPSDGIDRVIEADVVLNPNHELGWTTLPTASGISLQEIALHEFGHVLGLKHTVSRSAKMFFQVHFGGPQRTALTWDDISGISTRYPLMGLEQITGSITGRVTRDGEPVFGAFVIAVDGNGTCESSAITRPDGTYAIEFLPPGWYTLYAEPLDGPTTPFGIADHFFSPSLIDTNFAPTFAYDSSEALTQVRRKRSTSAVDIEVQPGPAQVDPRYLGTADSPYGMLRVTSSPARAYPGSEGHLVAAGTVGVQGLSPDRPFMSLGQRSLRANCRSPEKTRAEPSSKSTH